MGSLPMMSLAMVLGRRRLQQATAHALNAAAAGTRLMSSLPEHQVVGMPALSPTMTQGNLAKWHVKVGDAIQPGSILADVETDKATMPFENQDDGYVAKLLVKEGASNLPLGTPLLVVVEEEKSVSAFAQYSGPESAAPTTSAPAAPDKPPASAPASQPPASASTSKPASEYPPHEVLGMPSLSPTMEQGNILAWKVKEGDSVKAGQIIADIETDKATVGFEVLDDAFIAKILIPEGTMGVRVGSPAVVLVDDADLVSKFKDFSPQRAGTPAPAKADAAPAKPQAAAAPSKPKVVANHRLGPAARLLLEECGLSVSDVTPSGPHNIVTKGDVMAAIAAGVKPGSGAEAPAAAAAQAAGEAASAAPAKAEKPADPSKPAAAKAAPAAPAGKAPSFTDIPNTQIRKVIAQRLLESKVTIPSLYGAVDVEIDALSTLRKSLAEQGVKLSVNDFVLKAIARALKEVPAANSLWDASKQEAVPAPSIDISVAVATERGLITPIVKNADQKTLSQISKDVKDLAAKAKANKLKPEEFMGGSFTVSNLGMYGVSYFSAIINPPQGAILAVGGTQQRVRLVHGKPEAYHVMTVTLSADHRMYDGELLGQVLGAFKQHMQAPAALIM